MIRRTPSGFSKALLVGCATTGGLLFGAAAINAQAGPAEDVSTVCLQLLSQRPTERERAVDGLSRREAELSKGLLRNLDSLMQKPDRNLRSFGGAFHLTVEVTGELKIEDASDRLLPLIDFQLDPATEPIRGHTSVAGTYPVALALSRIGGKRLVTAILERLAQPANDSKVRACTWVLQAILGPDIAKAAVQQRLDSVVGQLKVYNRETSDAKDNLEKAKSLLEAKGAILLPSTPAVTPPDQAAQPVQPAPVAPVK